jgi:hypothetical protein
MMWAHGVHDEAGELVGVATVGRPVARALDDGLTSEVTRLATNGHPNACSMLYGAARRASIAKGYRRGLTYILESEDGASLRAAGWHFLWAVKGRSWDCPSRPRTDKHSTEDKVAYGWGAWPQIVADEDKMPSAAEQARATRDTEICAKCGFTYEGHIHNLGNLAPCWTPSGKFKGRTP